jgi:type IV secretion system protein VirB5
MKRLAMTTSLIFSMLSGTATAQGIPVYDNAQNVNQLQEIAHMVQQIETMADQLEAAKEGNLAITGTRNMGSLLNGRTEANMRRYTPDSLEDLIHIGTSDHVPATAHGVRSTYNRLYNAAKPLTSVELNPSNPSYVSAVAYERNVNTTMAAMAATDGAYSNATKRNETYEAMLSELNNTPDMKASIDLQTRANIENGMVLNELTRLMALQTQLLAAENNQDIADTREVYDRHAYPTNATD